LTDEHIDAEERYAIASRRSQHIKVAEIARCLGRHRSTIYRELKRNASTHDGNDRASHSSQKASGTLWQQRREARKQRRKHCAAYDSRGHLAGKKMIGERPAMTTL
jgi:IS30 family transposase